jgi:proline iminopeptidase
MQFGAMGRSHSAFFRVGAGAILAIALTGCLDPDEPGNLVPETVVDDPSLPHIEVNGTRLHAEAFGDPTHPMVMTLHGGPGGDYRSLLPLQALADDGYYVVFWDQRGAGLSERHDADSITLDQYLEDLRQVVEYYSSSPTHPVVFIGHSWGAMYAAWFINEHGDYGGQVRGAILSEPAGFTNQQVQDYMDRWMNSFSLASEQFNDIAWTDQFMSPVGDEREDYLLGLMTAEGPPAEHHDEDNPAPFWRFGATVAQRLPELGEEADFDWTPHLQEFAAPVLFLRGELNEALPLWTQEELAAYFASARIVTIPGTGHQMIWERSEEYLEHARTYFDEIGFEGGAQ